MPSNGEEYGGRTLTVNFNGSVNLASAKQNISLTANNAALTEGTDYTVALDENDETILNIVFKGTMTADAEYALTIGAELNKGCIGYAIFPEGTQAQTFKFTYKQDSGSDSVEVSAEKMTDEALLALVDDSTNVSIVTDGEDKVIKWSETETTTEKSKEVEKTRTISLGKTIDLTKGPVSVEFTAKLAGCRSYMVIRNGGTAIAPHAGITTWGVTDAPRVKDFSRYPLNMPDGDTSQDGQWRTGTTVISKGSANSGYYTYKYVIDYNANTIEFYSKAEGDTDWSYPLVKSLELDGKTTYAKKVNGVYQYGVTPQTALDSVCLTTKYHSDDASNTADYCVKSIKVYQTTTPAVESQSVSDEATDISDTLRKITYNMTTEILESDVNKTNIKLYEVDHGEEKAFDDYTLQIHEDHKGFDILISADLGVDKEFRVKISGLTADTAAQGEMTTESVTNFETAKSFEVSEPTVTTSDAKVEVAGNVRTYHKSSGEGFMVLAVLMTKNNEFVACKYFIGTAADASSGFKNNSYGTFEFDKPADFDPANYKVRFFVFNGMQGSASIAKTFETPLAQ